MTATVSDRIRPLDPKFAKVVALMRSTEHAGEKEAARSRAEAMAEAAGMSLDEAMAVSDPPASTGMFAGFDDYMEDREPGWKAERMAEKIAKRRAWTARCAALIEKYGSLDAAVAPCEREKLILAAVAPWRLPRAKDPRWTDNLDGWRGYGFERDKMPAHVLRAIEQAYPLPTTFAEAKAEHDHWETRDQELRDSLDKDGSGYGDVALDYAPGVRADIVRDMAERDLPITSLADLHARFL